MDLQAKRRPGRVCGLAAVMLFSLVLDVAAQSPGQALLQQAETASRARNPDLAALVGQYQAVLAMVPDATSYEHQRALERLGELHHEQAFVPVLEAIARNVAPPQPDPALLEQAVRHYETAAAAVRQKDPLRAALMRFKAGFSLQQTRDRARAVPVLLDALILSTSQPPLDAAQAEAVMDQRRKTLDALWYAWRGLEAATVTQLLADYPDVDARHSWEAHARGADRAPDTFVVSVVAWPPPARVPGADATALRAPKRVDVGVQYSGLLASLTAGAHGTQKAAPGSVIRAISDAFPVPVCAEYLDGDGTPAIHFVIDAGETLESVIGKLNAAAGEAIGARMHGDRLVVTLAGKKYAGGSAMDRLVALDPTAKTLQEGMTALEADYNERYGDLPMLVTFSCLNVPREALLQRRPEAAEMPLREAVLALFSATGLSDLKYGASITANADKQRYLAIRLRQVECRDAFADEKEVVQFWAEADDRKTRLNAYLERAREKGIAPETP